jgi:hypothetical protein
MVTMTKEKTRGISKEILKDIRELGEKQRRWEQEQKQKRPEAPNESGEVGIYDDDASKWFGGAFIYKTGSGKYFSLVGRDTYRPLKGVNFETYLKSIQSRKKRGQA